MQGGIDDVGCGVLFGLEMYRYEFAALLMHAEHLEAVHGVGPHTISVPRIKHADDIDPSAFDNSIDDDIFAKIIACIRIAVPYTGMIISTRESKATRERVIHYGISQISGASRTSVGGYTEPERKEFAANYGGAVRLFPTPCFLRATFILPFTAPTLCNLGTTPPVFSYIKRREE